MPILNKDPLAAVSLDEKVSLVDTLCAGLDSSEVGMSLNDAYNHMLAGADSDSDKEMEQLITLDRVMRQMRAALNSTTCYPFPVTGAA